MNEIEKSLKNAINDLNKIDKSPFSQKGYTQFTKRITEFIYSLYFEAHKISKVNQSDLISGEHVDIASNRLFRVKKSFKANILNSIGGALVGGTLSNIFAMTSYGVKFSTSGIILTVLAGVIGAFVLGVQLFNDNS